MITPNKIRPFEESILSKVPILLEMNLEELPVHRLFELVERKFSGVDEFICAVEVLYILDVIDVNFETGVMTYVD